MKKRFEKKDSCANMLPKYSARLMWATHTESRAAAFLAEPWMGREAQRSNSFGFPSLDTFSSLLWSWMSQDPAKGATSVLRTSKRPWKHHN